MLLSPAQNRNWKKIMVKYSNVVTVVCSCSPVLQHTDALLV